MIVSMESEVSADQSMHQGWIRVENTDLPDVVKLTLGAPEEPVFVLMSRNRWLDLQEIVEVVFAAQGRAE